MITPTRPSMLRAARGPVALSAEVRGQRDGFYSEIVNMSGTGALLNADRELAVGDVLFLSFAVPGAAEVRTEATVARVDGHTAGVAFHDVEEHEAAMIVRHVLRHGRPRA
jgi:hypothetical protein